MDNDIDPQDVTAEPELTFKDVAAQLGVSVRTVHNLKAQRKIGFVDGPGRRIRFLQRHVDACRATYFAAIEVPALNEPPVGTGLAA